jgi:hypothetical protein
MNERTETHQASYAPESSHSQQLPSSPFATPHTASSLADRSPDFHIVMPALQGSSPHRTQQTHCPRHGKGGFKVGEWRKRSAQVEQKMKKLVEKPGTVATKHTENRISQGLGLMKAISASDAKQR